MYAYNIYQCKAGSQNYIIDRCFTSNFNRPLIFREFYGTLNGTTETSAVTGPYISDCQFYLQRLAVHWYLQLEAQLAFASWT